MAIEVVPSGASLGAEIRGVDIREPLTDSNRDEILNAWHEHLILVFREQPMTDEQHVAFTRNFGTPENAALSEVDKLNGILPQISVVSNIIENGKPIGSLGAGEAYWHTDSSCDDPPPDGGLLRAIEIPPSGGDTYFTNLYEAYETLPSDLAAAVKGRRAVHDATYTAGGLLRKGRQEVTDVREAPGARQPLVRTHPATKRKALYLGRRLNGYIVGLPVDESEALLDKLWAHATQARFTWAQKWRVGDLVMWDNRCSMHRRDAFDGSQRRLMHRTQLRGTTPY